MGIAEMTTLRKFWFYCCFSSCLFSQGFLVGRCMADLPYIIITDASWASYSGLWVLEAGEYRHSLSDATLTHFTYSPPDGFWEESYYIEGLYSEYVLLEQSYNPCDLQWYYRGTPISSPVPYTAENGGDDSNCCASVTNLLTRILTEAEYIKHSLRIAVWNGEETAASLLVRIVQALVLGAPDGASAAFLLDSINTVLTAMQSQDVDTRDVLLASIKAVLDAQSIQDSQVRDAYLSSILSALQMPLVVQIDGADLIDVNVSVSWDGATGVLQRIYEEARMIRSAAEHLPYIREDTTSIKTSAWTMIQGIWGIGTLLSQRIAPALDQLVSNSVPGQASEPEIDLETEPEISSNIVVDASDVDGKLNELKSEGDSLSPGEAGDDISGLSEGRWGSSSWAIAGGFGKSLYVTLWAPQGWINLMGQPYLDWRPYEDVLPWVRGFTLVCFGALALVLSVRIVRSGIA